MITTQDVFSLVLLVAAGGVIGFVLYKLIRGDWTLMRFMMGIHLTWLKCEVGLAGLLVPGLVLESSIANGWVYAGGSFADLTSVLIGLARGFFFEVMTYVAARQAYLMAFASRKNKGHLLGCVLMALLALVLMIVSAVNNLGWVLAGHSLGGVLSAMGQIIALPELLRLWEAFLAVALPLSVGLIALVPLDHFYQHALEQDHLDNHALAVDERHMHRTAFLKAQRAQRDTIQSAYDQIAADRAQLFIEQVRQGDLTFGASGGAPSRGLPAPGGSSYRRPRVVTGTVWPADWNGRDGSVEED